MILHIGIDPSQSSPALVATDNWGKVVLFASQDCNIRSTLSGLSSEWVDVRVTIERPPLASTRLASAHFCANHYKRVVMELVPRAQVQFVHPSSWQSKVLGLGGRVARGARKQASISVAVAVSSGSDFSVALSGKGAHDLADAFHIACYGRKILSWDDRFACVSGVESVDELLVGVEL